MSAGSLSMGLSRPRRLDVDTVLAIATSCLLLLGLVMVASASITVADRELGAPFYYLQRHGTHLLVGLLLGLIVLGLPTDLWDRLSFLLLPLAIVLLAVVLLPGVGHEVNGAKRWVKLGVLNMQVSEPARLLLMMYMAGYLTRHRDAVQTSMSGFVRPLFFVVVACALLLAQPDFGAASVLLATCLAMMFVAGVRIRDFVMMLLPVVLSMAALVVYSPYRMERLTAFANPWADPYNSGFQLTQSLIAIGRGEWLGVGLGASVQKLFYLPEAHTDFVFAVLAEELGLIGVSATIVLYGLMVWRALAIGNHAAAVGRLYQAYLATGIGVWLGLQAVINIGVNMGVLPTKGLTLPLLSYGGSSLLFSLVALGLLFRIHHENVAAGQPAIRRKKKTSGKRRASRRGRR